MRNNNHPINMENFKLYEYNENKNTKAEIRFIVLKIRKIEAEI